MKLLAIILASLIHFIVTTPGEDASRQVTINWHSYAEDSYVELTRAGDTSFSKSVRISPQETLWSIERADSLFAQPRYVCRVRLDSLEKGTRYTYRVCAGDEKSSVYGFTTADGSRKWKFNAFTDFQPHSNPYTHPLIRLVDSLAGHPALSVCSGDLIDTAVYQDQWEWLLDGTDVFSRFLFASSPGDHEYWGLPFGKHIHQLEAPLTYRAIFGFPENGSECCPGSNYWFIYNNILFISLDTGDSNTPVSDKTYKQRDWLVETAAKLKGKYDYLIVLQHKSIQGSYTNDAGVNARLRPILAPAYVEAGVDLVLSGHDHMYSRTRRIDGVWYLDMGSSGRKTRIPDEGQYNDGLHEKIINLRETDQCVGAVVDVSRRRLEIRVYNRNSELVDHFSVSRRRR